MEIPWIHSHNKGHIRALHTPMLPPHAFLMKSSELMSRIFAFMNLPPVADAPGSQRKLFSHRSVEQSLCVSAHAWEKNGGSNRTMKDDALLHDIAIHCVFSSVYFDTLMRIFRQQFTFKWAKCWFNYNCFKYGATFAPLYPLSIFFQALCHKHKHFVTYLCGKRYSAVYMCFSMYTLSDLNEVFNDDWSVKYSYTV